MRSIAIYVHIPFCIQKCGYCDFNAYRYRAGIVGPYLAALRQEITHTAAETVLSDAVVPSIYFGGGTPSTLDPSELMDLLTLIRSRFPVQPAAEVTVEVDPGTIALAGLEPLRAAGFNRISIGVQAFDDDLLRSLSRIHTAADARHALAWARRAGFTDLNLDLIFGLPGQSLPAWETSLREAVSFAPTHLSVYGLTIEAGTPFFRRQQQGRLSLPDDEVQVAMFERADELLTAAGYRHYEISNYALPGWRSQHNLHYWHHGEYLGFGAGAHSYLDRQRWENERLPARYMRALAERRSAAREPECIDGGLRVHEGLMLGLRLEEGIDLGEFMTRYGVDIETVYAEPLIELGQGGYVQLGSGRLRLTHSGRLVADAVLSRLLTAD
jgi:oxygen-independent coproporphyrinogen-3 oxidase